MSEHAIVIGLYLLTGGMKDEHHVSRISHPSMHGVYGWLTGNLSVRIDEWRHDLVCILTLNLSCHKVTDFVP